MSNPCIECGKQRIDGKSWQGRVGASVVTYTLTICPDVECQKLVDKALAEKKEKTEFLAKKKIEAKLERDKLNLTTASRRSKAEQSLPIKSL